MAANLVSLVMQLLTPDLVTRIASALGIDRSLVQKAIDAAVPALLAALAGSTAASGGARKLLSAVKEQDPGVLSNLTKSDTGGYRAVSEQGSDLLGSLLGGQTQSELSKAVGKYAGLGEDTGSTLVGMLAPVVIATLRKQQSGPNLDSSGLADLLASQKGNISAALPAGFANLLGGTGILDSVSERAASAARTATEPVRRVAQKSSSLNWLAWAIPIVVVLAAAWYFLAHRGPEPTSPTTTTSTTVTQPAPNASLVVDGVDLGASVNSAIDGLKTSLASVTDAATAQAALPKLQEAGGALEKVKGLTSKLSAEQKSALAALIAAAMPILNPLFDKVLAIPGVSEIAKPVIDSIRAQLDQLAKA